jgi:hypothetical protein
LGATLLLISMSDFPGSRHTSMSHANRKLTWSWMRENKALGKISNSLVVLATSQRGPKHSPA